MEQQLENIKEMENILNKTTKMLQEFEQSLQHWEENLPDFKKMMNYYGSP